MGSKIGHTRSKAERYLDWRARCLRNAGFELSRRRAGLSYVRGEELEDIALQAADDALMAILRKLDGFRGESRFTTWAYKFARGGLFDSDVSSRGVAALTRHG